MKGEKKPVPPPCSPFSTNASEPIAVKKVAIIFNPFGGHKKGKHHMDKIVEPMFRDAGIEVVSHPTTHAGHATELARQLPLEGIDGLCALGGDGTLSEVLAGYLSREDGVTTQLGFIPGALLQHAQV